MNRRGFLGRLLAAPAAAVAALKATEVAMVDVDGIGAVPLSALDKILKETYSADFFRPFQSRYSPLLYTSENLHTYHPGMNARLLGLDEVDSWASWPRFRNGRRVQNRHDARRGRLRVLA